MSEAAESDFAESVDNGGNEKPRRRAFSLWPRFSLLTLMLLISLVAVWSWYVQLKQASADLDSRIEVLRVFSRELVMEDPARISIAWQQPGWYDESIWQVYIPEGQTYELHLATREILWPDVSDPDTPPSVAQTTLPPGTYSIELRQENAADDGQEVIVLIDGQPTLSYLETADWDSGRGSRGGSQWDQPVQPKHDASVVLFRRRFTTLINSSSDPPNGIQLWLERQ